MSEVDTIAKGETDPNLQLLDGALELGDSTSNNHDISTFPGKLKGDSSAHAIGAACDDDSLQLQVSVESGWKRPSTALTRPSTGNSFFRVNPNILVSV